LQQIAAALPNQGAIPAHASKGKSVILNIAAKILLIALLSATVSFRAAVAAEIQIPPLKAAPGQPVEVPVIIDRVDNLAGMKLVIGYDKDALAYQSTAKAKEAASLIHIVNDKRPGLLIAVMAGARGIKGEHLAILTFTFEVAENIPPGTMLSFRITESQLMSDKLKEVDHKTTASPLEIVKGEGLPTGNGNK
jgi:hypothetical protein